VVGLFCHRVEVDAVGWFAGEHQLQDGGAGLAVGRGDE
jgi:hypothetical protein